MTESFIHQGWFILMHMINSTFTLTSLWTSDSISFSQLPDLCYLMNTGETLDGSRTLWLTASLPLQQVSLVQNTVHNIADVVLAFAHHRYTFLCSVLLVRFAWRLRLARWEGRWTAWLSVYFRASSDSFPPPPPPDRARPSGSLSSRGGEPSLEWRGKRNVALWSLHPVSHGTQSPATPPPTLGSGSTPDLGHSGLGHGGGTVVLLFGLTLLRNNSEIEWASCGLQRRHTTIICHYWICVRVLINKAI